MGQKWNGRDRIGLKRTGWDRKEKVPASRNWGAGTCSSKGANRNELKGSGGNRRGMKGSEKERTGSGMERKEKVPAPSLIRGAGTWTFKGGNGTGIDRIGWEWTGSEWIGQERIEVKGIGSEWSGPD
jgi:hypothetical protein